MARDAAKEFLNRKRREQAQREQNVNITLVVPSAVSRYGLYHQMPNGQMMPGATHQGAMPSRYMGNTGLGQDGKLQPNMPTHMVRSAQGPQMIHEGEDMYRQPNGDVKVIPASNVPQSRLAAMERMYGMPGKQTGGTINMNADEELGPYGKASDFTESQYNAAYRKPPEINVTPGGGGSGSFGGLKLPEPPKAPPMRTPAPPPLPDVTPTTGGSGTFGGLKLPEPPTSPTTTPGGEPVVSPYQYDQMVLNRYMNRLGAINESERAAEAQRMLQGGASADDVRAMQAQTDVSRRAAMGEAVGNYATNAATRAEDRARFTRTQGFTERQWDEGKEQRDAVVQSLRQSIGDRAYDSLVNDVNSGMSIDEIRTKDYNADGVPDFPNFSETQYNSVRDAGPLGTRDYSRMLQAGDYAGINQTLTAAGLPAIDFSKMEAGDYNAVAGDLENLMAVLPEDADPKLIESISQMWLGVKKEQWSKLGVDIGTDRFESALTDVANSGNDPDTTSQAWTDFTRYAGTALADWVTTTDGVNAMVDLDSTTPAGGKLVDVIDALAQSPETATAAAKAAGFASSEAAMEELGAVMGARFALENKGTVSSTQKALLQKYGLYDEALDLVASEQRAEAETAAAEAKTASDDIALALKENDLPTALRKWNELTPEAKDSLWSQYGYLDLKPVNEPEVFQMRSGTYSPVHDWYQSKMGRLHRQMNYNDSVYKSPGSTNYLKMTDAWKKEINQMRGQTVNINNQTYMIDPIKPIEEKYQFDSSTIKSGNDKYQQKWYADSVRLINTSTGEVMYYNFDSRGQITDKANVANDWPNT